jgi:hypothetical protein
MSTTARTQSFLPSSASISRMAFTICPVVAIVSALWWARYVQTQPPSRRMVTASSSPKRAMSAAMSGRRVRAKVPTVQPKEDQQPYGPREKGSMKKIMNTVERQFPTEEEVDQWIETHLFGDALWLD